MTCTLPEADQKLLLDNGFELPPEGTPQEAIDVVLENIRNGEETSPELKAAGIAPCHFRWSLLARGYPKADNEMDTL